MDDVAVIAIQKRANVAPGEHDLRVVGLLRWVTKPNINSKTGQLERHPGTSELIVCGNCLDEEAEEALETERQSNPEMNRSTDAMREPHCHIHPPVEAYGWSSALEHHYHDGDYEDVTLEDITPDKTGKCRRPDIGVPGRHLKQGAQPHAMDKDEMRTYAAHLLRERYPEPQPATESLL